MKYIYLLLPIAFLFASCEKKQPSSEKQAAVAPVAAPTAEVSSFIPSLQKVSSHLDTNGEHFAITDVEGDLENFCELLDSIISTADIDELKNADFSTRDLLLQSGLNRITAKGESSRNLGDCWHNRSFYATSGKHQGVLTLLGKHSKPFATPTFAPKNADLVFETQINLKQINDIAKSLLANSLGEDLDKELKDALAEKLMGGALSLGDIFGKFDIRLSLALTLDANKTWQPDSESPKIPVMDLVARFDNAGWLWKQYGEKIEENAKVREENGLKYLLLPEAMPTPMGELQPLLVIDSKNDHIWFALKESSFKACLDGSPKLADSANFQTAMKNMPKDGNVLGYVSQELLKTAFGISKKIPLDEIPAERQDGVKLVLKKLTDYLSKSKSGYAFVLALQDEGILVAANSPIPNKGGGAATLAIPAAMSSLFIGASAYKKGADRAACILNIRNLQQAVRANQNLNDLKIGDPINWDDIIGHDKFLEIKPKLCIGIAD